MQLTAIAAVKRFEAESEASVAFGLCCHSNETAEPIVNPPNSAQLGDSLYHAPKLHPGPCISVGVRPWTDRHTDIRTQTAVTTIHFASSTTHAKCNEHIDKSYKNNTADSASADHYARL